MKSEILIDLPIGPSVNELYPDRGGRRRKSRKYKTWLTAAGWELKLQKPGKLDGPYRLLVKVPPAMRGDASNRIKAVEDLLVTHGVTPDDRYAISSGAERCETVPAGRCHALVRAA